MPIEKLKPNYTFTEDKIEQLKEILPEAFADGKINFETLKEALGEYLEEENQDREHFGLFWVGKRQARKIASIPSKGTLVPVKGEGIDEEKTKNIFIEGDNLEVLKLLQKSYANKIKMIYIDPPYNTGNDFVYEDDFSEPIKEYLRKTGQVDEKGRELTTNKKSDGRYHAKWLSMMYPRLSLARNLMQDDGLIFISIDDNEVHNLRLLCNEIFGEENFIDSIIWKKRYGGGAKEKYLVSLHEYILVYSKNIEVLDPIFIPLEEDSIKRYYTKTDSNFIQRGAYRTHPLEATKSMGERKNLRFSISSPENTDIFPKRQWLWGKEKVSEALKNNELEFIKDKEGNWSVHTKQYLKDSEGNMRQGKMFSIIDNIFTQHGTNEIISIFGNAQIFSFPKPSKLIKDLINICISNKDDIVLDLFSGSGTTAQAILDLNKEDGVNRNFICIQIPEKTKEDSEAYKAGYKHISEITKERIRRVINKIKLESEDKLDFQENSQDLGFKVFKLQESNYKEWKDFEGKNTNQLEISFDNALSPLIQNWQKDGLLSEIMIIEGFTLDSNIKILEEYSKNQIYEISSDFCSHKLLVCLDEKLEKTTIDSLSIEENDIFICLDSAIDDNNKIILSDKGLIKTI